MVFEHSDKNLRYQGVYHLPLVSVAGRRFSSGFYDQIQQHFIALSMKKQIRDFTRPVEGSLEEAGKNTVSLHKSKKHLLEGALADQDVYKNSII